MIKVFINGGHGSPDPGAVGSTGLTEREVAFNLMNETAEFVRSAGGYEVLCLQSDDLVGVIRKANAWEADIFLSIHCNAFTDPDSGGTETLYHPNSSKGKKLAQKIQDQLVNELGLYNRGIKSRTDLGVLTQTDMPSSLAEIAFISNPKEEQILKNEQTRISKALARGVTDYFA